MNLSVKGPLIQEKALELAKEMGIAEFKALSGWLTRFKQGHLITDTKLSGERASVHNSTVPS